MTRRATLALLVLISACGGDDEPDAMADDEIPCTLDYPSFTPGMSVPAGALTVKLLSIAPKPPRQKVKNDWVLQVLDANGAPADVMLANPDSYMPAHMHHGNTSPIVVSTSERGTLQLNDIDFIMRGPWQVSFDVHRDGATVGKATFQICVE